MIDDFHFDKGVVRALIYVPLSILTFHGPTICAVPGSFVVVTSFLYICDYCVKRAEERETAAKSSYNPVPGERVPISGGAGSGGGGGSGRGFNF